MTSRVAWLLPFALAAAAGCAPQPQALAFRSLESSGTAAFVCLSLRDGDDKFSGTRSIKDCPDTNPVDGEARRTFALVTQRNRGEVAVLGVDAHDSESGKIISGAVVDEEPSVPGFNFLPVGSIPVDVVATPGSAAAFVATAEVGKEGIYVVPSLCALRRDTTRADPVRDITLWPACHLPSAPGKMTVLIDPPAADGSIRTSCVEEKPALPDAGASPDGGGKPVEFDAGVQSTAAQDGRACPARIASEPGPRGRRKLAVTLPDLGQIVIIDAQELADREPGSFGACPIEGSPVVLKAQLPTGPILQRLPPDLDDLYPEGFPYPPRPENIDSRPAGIARLDDSNQHELFVADSQAPVIHVLDTSDPCRLTELPSLLPVSYYDPNRLVTASKLAVMDRLTLDGGKRFLSAIDQIAEGQVMIFDVSPDSTERTPIVRPRSKYMQFEPPDRLQFSAPAVDVAFVTENPARSPDPATGTETLVTCDPTPGSESAGTKYRPSIPDYSTGASPGELRGTFGLLALSNGQIAVVDVEDLDKPCRRPLLPNPDAPPKPAGIPPEDFRGCVGDGTSVPFTKDGTDVVGSIPTVTTEATCRVVEQHRGRSGSLILTDGNRGIHAPAIRVAPKLVDKDSRGLVTDDTDQGRRHPKMLGVNFENFSAKKPQNNAQVFIGTDFWETNVAAKAPGTADAGPSAPPPQNELVIDPALAQRNSLVLSLSEPRTYGGDENFSATYEGKLFDDRPAGVFQYPAGDDPNQATLRDTSLPFSNGFCGAGVESMDVTRHRAVVSSENESRNIGVLDVERFVEDYADYLVITSDLLPDTDAYWHGDGRGATCHGADPNQDGAGRIQCQVFLGTLDPPTNNRKLRIVRATRDTLTVTPKVAGSPRNAQEILDTIACCFPDPVRYHVRVSNEWLVRGNGVEHDIVPAAPNFICVNDPSPLRTELSSRAFEVSCDGNSPNCLQKDSADPTQPGRAIIGPDSYDPVVENGPRVQPTQVCVIKNPSTDLQTIKAGPLPGCIFTSFKSNFVVYRGTEPSQPDMSFQWQISGGFSPLLINLNVANDPNTSPQSLVSSPFDGTIMVADGGDKGLVVVDLASFNAYPIY